MPKTRSKQTIVSPIELTSQEKIKRLRELLTLSKIKHEDYIMKQPTLKDAHVYCVLYNISAQQYGPMLERFIREKFRFTKNKAEHCIGDCSKDGQNIEVKVSLGGSTHAKFNYVQLRPSHTCDFYIFTAYHLCMDNVDTEGELYIFKVPKSDLNKLIVEHGGYAHGTLKEHGAVTMESLNSTKSIKEYAIRPSVNDACWKALLKFRIFEESL